MIAAPEQSRYKLFRHATQPRVERNDLALPRAPTPAAEHNQGKQGTHPVAAEGDADSLIVRKSLNYSRVQLTGHLFCLCLQSPSNSAFQASHNAICPLRLLQLLIA